MADNVIAVLKKASSGLLYPSESDEPFEPFCWEEKDVVPEDKVAALSAAGAANAAAGVGAASGAGGAGAAEKGSGEKASGKKKKKKVAEISIEDFFGELAESDDAKKFQKLEAVLRDRLTDLKVLRVEGGPRVDVYVVGKDKTSGKWAGLHTVSVET